jgi:hypothetical protein
MFGSKKKKIQVKSVEDYLKGEDARVPAPEARTAPSPAVQTKVKPFVAQAVVTLFILALMLVAFSQLSRLRSQMAELQAAKEGDARALTTKVGELTARLEKSDKQVSVLSDSISALQKDLDAQRSLRAKTEAAEAARKAAVLDKKKTPKPAR